MAICLPCGLVASEYVAGIYFLPYVVEARIVPDYGVALRFEVREVVHDAA